MYNSEFSIILEHLLCEIQSLAVVFLRAFPFLRYPFIYCAKIVSSLPVVKCLLGNSPPDPITSILSNFSKMHSLETFDLFDHYEKMIPISGACPSAPC